MSNELMVIPQELEAMAVSLPNEKKLEIVSAVKNVFQNVQKMRVQLEAINVADENDKVSMKLANTVRMAIRTERLAAEKFIDSKRETVQMLMSDFKTEDALWLKTKQLMQIETKSVEDLAKYKETTGERIMAERKATLEAQRQLEVSKYTEYPTAQLSDMEMQVYEAYLQGLKVSYEAKIEAEKVEAERLEAERLAEVERQKAIEEENARLKAEAEQKEKERLAEIETKNKRFEIRKKIMLDLGFEFNENAEYNFSLSGVWSCFWEQIYNPSDKEFDAYILDIKTAIKNNAERKALEEKAQKEREEANAILKAEQEKARIESEKSAKEKAALEAELKAKQQAESEAIAKRNAEILAEEKAKALAAKAPRKEKLTKWVESFEIPMFENDEKANDILSKFESFKALAKSEIEKL